MVAQGGHYIRSALYFPWANSKGFVEKALFIGVLDSDYFDSINMIIE